MPAAQKPRRGMRSVAASLAMATIASVSGMAGVTALAVPASATPASSGGPVVLDGMDPLCHASMGENTGGYVTTVLGSVISKATRVNDGSVAVLGMGQNEPETCDYWGAGTTDGQQIDGLLSQLSPQPAVTYSQTPAELDDFFSQLSAGTIKPAVLWIPDDWSRDSTIEDALTAHANDLADFVNSGGALFSDMGSYGWLTALLPHAVYNDGGCNGGPSVTAAGQAAFPALNDNIVEACWHGYFSGDTGALVPLVAWPYPDDNSDPVGVAIGGASVTLPSAFSMSGPSAPQLVGTAATVTATLKDGQGVATPGARVNFSVTSGPDSGLTGTQTTDSSGNASLDLPGASGGTDTVTADTVVNGVDKTTGYSVEFQAVPSAPALSPTAGDSSLTVGVAPGSPVDGSVPTGIAVTVSPGGLTQTLPASGGTITVPALTNGTIYTITAVTQSAVGNSDTTTATATPHPAAPAVSPVTSNGTGTAVQTGSVAFPSGGSITLLDANGDPTNSVSIPGEGTYTLDPTSGIITFAPALGFSGDASGVTYQITDAYGTTGTSTYQPHVDKPAAPIAAPVTTNGGAGTQNSTVTLPAGGGITLINNGVSVTSITIPGQGTYSVNTITGELSFAPAAGFVGQVQPVTYRLTDAYGSSSDAAYTATVAPHGVASATAPNLMKLATQGTTIPVTCKLSSGLINRCDVSLTYRLFGRSVVVGSGSVTVGGNGVVGQVVVPVRLNAVGHYLATLFGGVGVTASATLTQSGNPAALHAATSTRFVNATVKAPQAVYFGTGSAGLRSSDAAYLNSLRSKLAGVRTVTCAGNTDNTANWFTNWLLGTSRAASVCNYLTRGTKIHKVFVSNGQAKPAASNNTAFGRQLNRRTDITFDY